MQNTETVFLQKRDRFKNKESEVNFHVFSERY